MARASSGPAYPELFRAAAAYAGFGGSRDPSPAAAISRFSNDSALLLYGLHQQATLGPCTVPKPKAWNPVEQSKWNRKPRQIDETDPETRTILSEKVAVLETQDKNIILEGLGCVGIYDQWEKLPVSGQQPRSRYEHGAAVLQDKMYIFGGNHNGRYLNDTQVLDMKKLTWSKINATANPDPKTNTLLAPSAGHSLVSWGNGILFVAGRTKVPMDTVVVKKFDLQTCTWSSLETYGKAPVSRGGQSVTLVGSNLVMFGGEDAMGSPLNDVHVLNLQTMTWTELDVVGFRPSPRSYHSAAVHAERYLLIFGGRSHSTCHNDLHILDLQNMEWSRPVQQGIVPAPRAGHAGVTIGENWFIVGGGDNKNGITEILVLNMSTLVWSIVTTRQENVLIASEGLSLVVGSSNGEDVLVAFGGYNGKYNNEVFALKPSYKSDVQPKLDIRASEATDLQTKDVEADTDTAQDVRTNEIAIDDVVVEHATARMEETNKKIIESLKAKREELEAALSGEQMKTFQLKQELIDAQTRNAELMKELQSVRSQLANEQSRCFKLEVDMAEIRQKLLAMEALQREVELLQRQKATSEEAAIEAKQKRNSGGVWGWLAGSPPEYRPDLRGPYPG